MYPFTLPEYKRIGLGNSNLLHQLTVLLTSCNRPVIIMIRYQEIGLLTDISFVACSRYWCVATDWTVRGSNTGRRQRAFSSHKRPESLWVPLIFLFIGKRMVFTRGKAEGSCVDHSTLFYSGGYESVELLIPYTSS